MVSIPIAFPHFVLNSFPFSFLRKARLTFHHVSMFLHVMGFRSTKGHEAIRAVLANIEAEHATNDSF